MGLLDLRHRQMTRRTPQPLSKFLHYDNEGGVVGLSPAPKLWVRSRLKLEEFRDAENLQPSCRMIIRHVKNPLSVHFTCRLSAKLNSKYKFHVVRAQLPPSGEETGRQNYLRQLVLPIGCLTKK
ncbi:hypothetical protein TNCV_3723851 [Trichonephila clavipes]|nr:hypothetical protein TNCV_3723851 [Trichonephila clavipes]